MTDNATADVANGRSGTRAEPLVLVVGRCAAQNWGLATAALTSAPQASLRDPLTIIDWVNLYAMAVNEENAAGGRVVTAPTHGAAGIVPAVLLYSLHFVAGANGQGVIDFLLTAAAIGILYMENASISGAAARGGLAVNVIEC